MANPRPLITMDTLALAELFADDKSPGTLANLAHELTFRHRPKAKALAAEVAAAMAAKDAPVTSPKNTMHKPAAVRPAPIIPPPVMPAPLASPRQPDPATVVPPRVAPAAKPAPVVVPQVAPPWKVGVALPRPTRTTAPAKPAQRVARVRVDNPAF